MMMMMLVWKLCIARPKNVKPVKQDELNCVIKNEIHNLWQPLMSFTWERLMNWLRTISKLLQEKLLSSLAFYRNVWVILLVSFNIGSVPLILTAEMKALRVDICQQLLSHTIVDNKSEKVLCSTVTADKTWIHHYDRESKSQSMEYCHKSLVVVKINKSRLW